MWRRQYRRFAPVKIRGGYINNPPPTPTFPLPSGSTGSSFALYAADPLIVTGGTLSTTPGNQHDVCGATQIRRQSSWASVVDGGSHAGIISCTVPGGVVILFQIGLGINLNGNAAGTLTDAFVSSLQNVEFGSGNNNIAGATLPGEAGLNNGTPTSDTQTVWFQFIYRFTQNNPPTDNIYFRWRLDPVSAAVVSCTPILYGFRVF